MKAAAVALLLIGAALVYAKQAQAADAPDTAMGEAGATGALTGLPIPAVSIIRTVMKQVKNAKIKKQSEFFKTKNNIW